MTTWSRMRQREDEGLITGVCVVGAGFIGRGLVHTLERSTAIRPALVVNRSVVAGVRAFEDAGFDSRRIVVSDDPSELETALAEGRPAVTASVAAAWELDAVDVVVEATGAMEHGADVVLGSLDAGRDVVSFNAELDALLGHLLHERARASGAVYTIADGDQPGVLLRQLDHVTGMGFEIVAAVNCKRNLDVHQDPDDSRPYAERDGTSVLMTTAFGDGTKMQIENCVVANLSGLVPDRRGMHGVSTTLETAVADVTACISRPGVVEYTLGGDFGGGVFVIGRSEDPLVRPYMRYGKLGDGPDYLFFRPYHLLHLEAPLTIAEVVLDRKPLAAPVGPPVADVVAVAKRDLAAGEALDGIGGYACYGHVDTTEGADGMLPIGLAAHARLKKAVARDEPVPLDSVELEQDAPLVRLRREQEALVAATVS